MFITYNDLDDMRDSRKRSQINAFVNRSRKANKVKSAQRQARAVQWQSRHPLRSAKPIKSESEDGSASGYDKNDIRDRDISKELIYALLKRRHLPSYALQYGLGGLRRDPFASFPVPQTDQIDWAADFFTTNFSAMNAQLYTDNAGNWLIRTLFPLALQSDMLFEALVLSMARYSHPASKDALIPGGVHFAHLRSSVLTKLHHVLSMEEDISTSDTTVHTFFAGHDDHAAAHLKGLQTLVSLRGGVEHGGFDRYTKFNLTGTHALCEFAEQRLRGPGAPPVIAEPVPDYPSHPFSPQLCADIATLPLGLSDVALEGRLSVQLIELFCRISKMAQQSPMTNHVMTEQIYNVSMDLLAFVTRTHVSALERTLSLCTYVFMLRETPDRNQSQHFYGDFLTNLRRRFQQISKTFMTLDGVGPELAIWGVAIFAMENSAEKIGLDENERSELFQELVRQHPIAVNWRKTLRSLKRFFFLDSCVEEYRTWWTKQIEQYKSRPRKSQ